MLSVHESWGPVLSTSKCLFPAGFHTFNKPMDMAKKSNEQIEFEQACAAITKIHSMLGHLDLDFFYNYCTLHAEQISNQSGADISKTIRQRDAILAFQKKGSTLRIAKNNLNKISKEFTKKHKPNSNGQEK